LSRSEEWSRRPELRRRCALLHHGSGLIDPPNTSMRRDDSRRTANSPRNVRDCASVGWGEIRCEKTNEIGKRLTSKAPYKLEWSFMDRLSRRGRSSVLQRPLAPWHGQRISGLIAAWALRTMQFASGVEPTIANLRVQIGRYTATGKANGIRIHRRSEQMSATC